MGSTAGLYIIQFIPSSFSWKSGGITIYQKIKPINSWEPYLHFSLTIHSHKVCSPCFVSNHMMCFPPRHLVRYFLYSLCFLLKSKSTFSYITYNQMHVRFSSFAVLFWITYLLQNGGDNCISNFRPLIQSTAKSSTLNLRIPFWTSLNGGKAALNDQDLSLPSPGTFVLLFPVNVLDS